jgi:aspartyl protease family protein
MKQLVLSVITFGLAVGWLAPGDEAADKKRAVAETYGPRSVATQGWGSSHDAIISRSSDGHFYADVSIDSQDVRMLVDTGASVIALTGRDALALGIEWDDDELFPVARGANGSVTGKPIRLDRVRLGDLEAEGVEGVIVPRGLDVSLLGQSFLGRVGKVEVENGQMVLSGS